MRYSDNFGYRSIEDNNTNPLVREIEERLKDPFLRPALLEKNSFQTHKKWKKLGVSAEYDRVPRYTA